MEKMKMILTLLTVGAIVSCSNPEPQPKIDIIFDTDANNELDDQHAMAYMMLDEDVYNILGITTNATRNGGDITQHDQEARRIISLCNRVDDVQLYTGANGSFEEIKNTMKENPAYDGYQAVDYIIERAQQYPAHDKLTIMAVGKLTNIALALKKEPTISDNIRLVWLGSNYPEPGEYNLEDDIPSMNYIIDSTDVHFEIMPACYNRTTGTDIVKVSKVKAMETLPGLGPKVTPAVEGRHGGMFDNFGDYAANLFEHFGHYGEDQARALFDMAALSVVKNPNWATPREIPAPIMIDEEWVERPNNTRMITLWEYFDKDAIIDDFYKVIER